MDQAKDYTATAASSALDRRQPGAPWWRRARDDVPSLPDSAAPHADEPGASRFGAKVEQAAHAEGMGSAVKASPATELSSGLGATLATGMLLVALLISARLFDAPVLSRILVPAVGISGAIAFSRRLARRHPGEPWLTRLLVLGVCAKLIASVIRYRTLVDEYGTVGDATVYDKYGRRFVAFWTGAGPEPFLDNIRKSNFLRWFTGVVYYLFGVDMIAGFMVLGLFGIVG